MTDAVRQQSVPTEWTIGDLAGIHAVLTDERFGVAAAHADTAPMGTVDWLRTSVSRFCNGPEHERRRALVVAELDRLDPAVLRASARSRAEAMLRQDGRAGGRDRLGQEELVAAVARHVPAAVLADQFGVADPDRCADAVADVAAAYFPGADEPARRAADAATRSLLDMLADAGADAGTDAAVARITAMVQGCDATASLIAAALGLLPELPDECSSDDLLAQTVYRSPPLRAIRRVALAPADLDGRAIATGDRVTCDIGAVRGEADEPAGAAPDGDGPADDQPAAAALTFGYGARPCPGPEHALALAAGVIDAVRTATG